ncbi:MAG: hypothetical protein JW803_02555 [Endomicrobiales bacterium]|nr:hypothetical protein [Endomicrobiales bacterium]
MRLWSLNPKYLDVKGLLALWREGLLAKAVLAGKTRGYRRHPQLSRFKASKAPLLAIESFLRAVYAEAQKRDYKFNKTKISMRDSRRKILVTRGQITHEARLLKRKLAARRSKGREKLKSFGKICLNPVFKVCEGRIEPWEKSKISVRSG